MVHGYSCSDSSFDDPLDYYSSESNTSTSDEGMTNMDRWPGDCEDFDLYLRRKWNVEAPNPLDDEDYDEDYGAVQGVQVKEAREVQRPPPLYVELCLVGEVLEDGGSGSSKKRCKRLWSRLPPGMVEEVLVRLPARSLARFLVVCKAWRDMLSSRHFRQRSFMHATKRLVHPVCSVHYGSLLWRKHLFNILHVDLSFLPEVFHSEWTRMFARSSLGLICIGCFENDGNLHLCVVNPMNRDFHVLPPVFYYVEVVAVLTVELPAVSGAPACFKVYLSDPHDVIEVDTVYSSITGAWKSFERVFDDYEMRFEKDLPFSWNGRLYTMVRSDRPRLVELNTEPGKRYLWNLPLPFFGGHHLRNWSDDCFLAEHLGRLLCCRGGIWMLDDMLQTWVKVADKVPQRLRPDREVKLTLTKVRVAGDLVVFVYALNGQYKKFHAVAYNMLSRCWQKVPKVMREYNELMEATASLHL